MTPLRCNSLTSIEINIRNIGIYGTPSDDMGKAFRNFERSVFAGSGASLRHVHLTCGGWVRRERLTWPPVGLGDGDLCSLESLSIEELHVYPVAFAEQLRLLTQLRELKIYNVAIPNSINPADWQILLQALSSMWPTNVTTFSVSSRTLGSELKQA